jgi:hypothetical protein
MPAGDMADEMTTSRVAKFAVVLITIFGLLFMHGVTPAAAAPPHCQDAPAHHHSASSQAEHHATTNESESSNPSADHSGCIGNHAHPCAGVVRKAVHLTVDALPIAYDYDNNVNNRTSMGTTGSTRSNLSPPPDLRALCISRT